MLGRIIRITRSAEMTEMPTEASRVVDLAALAQASADRGPVWTCEGNDLHLNLLVFDETGGVAEHVNDEVEVLVVGVAGEGAVEIDGRREPLRGGQAIVIPKGARRAIRSAGGRFAYLTCHRRRAGLWPAGVPRPH
jgi:mannose-6-phosphate isomerase-like protein (cupin superfamily)